MAQLLQSHALPSIEQQQQPVSRVVQDDDNLHIISPIDY